LSHVSPCQSRYALSTGYVKTPEDTQYIYDHTDVAGFLGLNNMDYGEMPIKEAVDAFKSARLKG
jgi:predicted TIM-barrel enzyme